MVAGMYMGLESPITGGLGVWIVGIWGHTYTHAHILFPLFLKGIGYKLRPYH